MNTVVNAGNVTRSQNMTGAQCRMARAALLMGVRQLAALADVSPTTVTRLEKGEGLHRRTVDAIRAVLENLGVIFIVEDEHGGPGVRVRKELAQ